MKLDENYYENIADCDARFDVHIQAIALICSIVAMIVTGKVVNAVGVVRARNMLDNHFVTRIDYR